MIYVLYGQPGSGKTTIGKLLAEHLDTPHLIDGDEFREMFVNKDYSKEGRIENITRANTVATYLSKTRDRPVVLSLVNPYEYQREDLKLHNKYVTIVLLTSKRTLRKKYHVLEFEIGAPDFILNTDRDPFNVLTNLLSMLEINR